MTAATRRPRFTWRRNWFTDPRNVFSFGGWEVGRIFETDEGWRWVSATSDEAPAALTEHVPATTSVSTYETPAEARAGLEVMLRPVLRGVTLD